MRAIRRMVLWGTVAAGLGLAGCGGDGGGGSGNSPQPPPSQQQSPVTESFTCKASVGPVRFDWAVTADEELQLTDESGQTLLARRKSRGAGTRPIYGTWFQPTSTNASGPVTLSVTASLTFDETSVQVESDCQGGKTMISARVSSQASYTDRTVQFLESKTDTEYGTATL
jgi:hypothetical protein